MDLLSGGPRQLVRLRLSWSPASSAIPLLGTVGAIALDQLIVDLDEAVFEAGFNRGEISPSAATTLLAAIGGGMVTFTGLVFSLVALILQFGSSQYSPRTVAHFLGGRTPQWILAIFLGTIVFSFLSLLDVGSAAREEFIPTLAVATSVLLLIVSLLAFVLLVQVGDGISQGARIATVSRASRRPSDRTISRCLVVEQERSLRLDPLYTLRLLVDIALRALSPGVNDPTTAVRSLDTIESVLRTVAPAPVGPIALTRGRGRVVLRRPTWADIVNLALMEALAAGIGAPQVTRRLMALLDDLLADVPPERRPPLQRYRALLVEGVATSFPPDARTTALIADRQGIGGSRAPRTVEVPVG